MKKEKMIAYMSGFVPEHLLKKIDVIDDTNGKLRVLFNPHGLGRSETRSTILDAIYSNSDAFTIEVIHGYNNGTAIKDMIATERLNDRIVNRYCKKNNPGRTVLDIRARDDHSRKCKNVLAPVQKRKTPSGRPSIVYSFQKGRVGLCNVS